MLKKAVLIAAVAVAVASSGWVYALRATSAAPSMYVGSFERSGCRILFWDNVAGPQGQFTVAYSAPTWSEKIATQLDSVKPGQRARLGKDQWTNLDTNIDLTIGGTEIKAGYYYFAVERSEDGWSLVVLDAARVQKLNTDPFLTHQITGGTVIPMTYTVEEDLEDELSIEFITKDKKIALEILWGPHKLITDVVPALGE